EFALYGLPNQSLAGTINAVQVFARAKSNLVPQHADGEFKILLSPDGVCTDEYTSNDKNLVTGYATYSQSWVENPQTALPFTWADIDAMCIGTKCSSPTVDGDIRSTRCEIESDGFWHDNPPFQAWHDETTTNWDNEIVCGTVWGHDTGDNDPDINEIDKFILDSYHFSCPHIGTPVSITVFCKFFVTGITQRHAIGLADATDPEEGLIAVGHSWEGDHRYYWYTCVENPFDHTPWTWAAIDRMEPLVGISLGLNSTDDDWVKIYNNHPEDRVYV
ncbi:unnamed protein product, partial [marine sediment metagenome]